MNANEIVRALRASVEIIDDPGDNLVLKALKGHMTNAADLIESLQAENNSLAANGGRYMAIAEERYKMYEKATKRAEEAEQRLAEKTEEAEMYKMLRMDADRIREGLMDKEARLISENMRLESQLAESQRREKAAGCDGCAEYGKWENEIEYGYPSHCTRCKRRCKDNWRGPEEGEGE